MGIRFGSSGIVTNQSTLVDRDVTPPAGRTVATNWRFLDDGHIARRCRAGPFGTDGRGASGAAAVQAHRLHGGSPQSGHVRGESSRGGAAGTVRVVHAQMAGTGPVLRISAPQRARLRRLAVLRRCHLPARSPSLLAGICSVPGPLVHSRRYGWRTSGHDQHDRTGRSPRMT